MVINKLYENFGNKILLKPESNNVLEEGISFDNISFIDMIAVSERNITAFTPKRKDILISVSNLTIEKLSQFIAKIPRNMLIYKIVKKILDSGYKIGIGYSVNKANELSPVFGITNSFGSYLNSIIIDITKITDDKMKVFQILNEIQKLSDSFKRDLTPDKIEELKKTYINKYEELLSLLNFNSFVSAIYHTFLIYLIREKQIYRIKDIIEVSIKLFINIINRIVYKKNGLGSLTREKKMLFDAAIEGIFLTHFKFAKSFEIPAILSKKYPEQIVRQLSSSGYEKFTRLSHIPYLLSHLGLSNISPTLFISDLLKYLDKTGFSSINASFDVFLAFILVSQFGDDNFKQLIINKDDLNIIEHIVYTMSQQINMR